MKNDDPMFDIGDSENIKLTNNEAASSTLLKAKNVQKITADNNKAGLSSQNRGNRVWHQRLLGQIIVPLIVAVVAGIIISVINSNFKDSMQIPVNTQPNSPSVND